MPPTQPAIEVAGLHRHTPVVAVEDISFEVAEGEIFGLLGPNGAGKRRAVECIQGLRRPDAGQVRVSAWTPRRGDGTAPGDRIAAAAVGPAGPAGAFGRHSTCSRRSPGAVDWRGLMTAWASNRSPGDPSASYLAGSARDFWSRWR